MTMKDDDNTPWYVREWVEYNRQVREEQTMWWVRIISTIIVVILVMCIIRSLF
jgi:type IV secretory pathway component VirB8